MIKMNKVLIVLEKKNMIRLKFNLLLLKFMFSKHVTKIDEIFTVNLTLCKGQVISKCLFGVFNCLFLEVFTAWQFAFEINWPLVSVKSMVKILSNIVAFLENTNFIYL